MFIAYVVVTVLFVVVLATAATLDFTRFKPILINMAKAGVPESWLTMLGMLKAAGAFGLLVGIRVPLIGGAAAVGLILFFVGAVIAHWRAHYYSFAPPVGYLTLAVTALVLRLASS